MGEIEPVWLAIGATAFALLVFANGVRLLGAAEGEKRKMGLFHMVLAPVFVACLWTVLIMNRLL